MTANAIVYTNLSTKDGAPVVDDDSTPDLTTRDISVWTSITNWSRWGRTALPQRRWTV
ncbi:hypothetical protein [Nonomuraea sp. NPDC050783]|uniref:hypothetical protein n=1 Tax=Nonomuraea sp. NPDC050783 TaxID=3154634 RepID=UPI0034650960